MRIGQATDIRGKVDKKWCKAKIVTLLWFLFHCGSVWRVLCSVRPPDAAESADDAARLHVQPGRQRGALRVVRRPRVKEEDSSGQTHPFLLLRVLFLSSSAARIS